MQAWGTKLDAAYHVESVGREPGANTVRAIAELSFRRNTTGNTTTLCLFSASSVAKFPELLQSLKMVNEEANHSGMLQIPACTHWQG